VNSSRNPPGIWEGQWLHAIGLVVLLPITGMFWVWLDKPFPALFWTCIAVPILHQVFVWLSWRFELLASTVSKTIGFRFYLVIFFVLFAARFVTVLWLAFIDNGSLALSFYPRIVLCLHHVQCQTILRYGTGRRC